MKTIRLFNYFMFMLLAVAVASASSVFAQSAADATLTGASLAGDSQFLGEYTVTAETSKSLGKKDLCKNPSAYPGSNLWCGRKLWAYQNSKSLMLISTPTQNDIAADFLPVFGVDGKGCKGSGSISDAIEKGIGNLNLCALPNEDLSETTPAPATDSFTWTFLIVLGPHTSVVNLNASDLSHFTYEDIMKSQGIDYKMTLTRSAN